MATFADIAALIARHMIPANPVVGGGVTEVLDLVGETPTVLVTVGGDVARRATYLPPHAITPGDPVFVARQGPALTSDLVVVATNIQAGPWRFGVPTNTGAVLGVAPSTEYAATPSTDWAADVADSNRRRGAILPLILGRIPG